MHCLSTSPQSTSLLLCPLSSFDHDLWPTNRSYIILNKCMTFREIYFFCVPQMAPLWGCITNPICCLQCHCLWQQKLESCERVWTKNPINCNHDNGCTWCVASWGCKLVTMITCCVLFYNPVLNTSYLHYKSYTYSKNSMHVIWSITVLVIYFHNYYEPKDNSNCCQTSVINIVSTNLRGPYRLRGLQDHMYNWRYQLWNCAEKLQQCASTKHVSVANNTDSLTTEKWDFSRPNQYGQLSVNIPIYCISAMVVLVI